MTRLEVGIRSRARDTLRVDFLEIHPYDVMLSVQKDDMLFVTATPTNAAQPPVDALPTLRSMANGQIAKLHNLKVSGNKPVLAIHIDSIMIICIYLTIRYFEDYLTSKSNINAFGTI